METKIEVQMRPVGPLGKVGQHVWWMDCELMMNNTCLGLRKVRVYNCPITDRRVARRISRRTGWSFRWHKRTRQFKFNDGSGAA